MPIALSAASAAMHGALVPIFGTTLTNSTTRDISIGNIPQGYQDLRLVLSGRTVGFASTTDAIALYLNTYNSPSLVTSTTYLRGDGSSATSARETVQNTVNLGYTSGQSATSGIFSSTTIDILNYSNTSTFKTMLSRNACDLNGSGITQLTVGLWRSTSAVTSFTIFPTNGSNTWLAGTTITIYGIRSVGQ